MAPTRDVFWIIPSNWIFLIVLIVAFALFATKAYTLVQLLKIGQAENRLGNLGDRIDALLVYVLGQRRLFKELGPGLMHAFIFWGFLVLTVGTINIIIKGLVPGPDKGWGIPIIDGNPVFLLVTDFFLVAVAVAVLVAFYRRLVTKPQRITLSRDALLILSLILALVVTEMLAEGFLGAWEGETSLWSPIAAVLAPAFSGLSKNATWIGFSVMWWAHILVLLFFLTYLPRSKHLHIMTAPFNVFFRNLGNRGALSKLDIENSETFGAS